MFKGILNLLNCNLFASVCVNCCTNNSIATLSNNLNNLVSVSFPILSEKLQLF
ncbi:hypothetical protein MtrunA17_Chr8g0359101 [Medicago truncatula]|uniref:Transmembrane protein n=1 Tax=Medicago truncatula TaxID=3880 RepID=A0A396GQ37_MEDTR|nr:hypothetical protein MtrunA17_Chr8g0359101 [Medicago truncatula]